MPMSEALNLTVPDEFEEWPHETRSFVLAEANTVVDLRRELDSLAGITGTDYDNDNAVTFCAEELATIILALGGPQGAGSA